LKPCLAGNVVIVGTKGVLVRLS